MVAGNFLIGSDARCTAIQDMLKRDEDVPQSKIYESGTRRSAPGVTV